MDWSPIFLSFKLALVTTIFLLMIGVPLGYWLAFTKHKLKPIFEAIISLPLVLPPTVIGFYLLISLNPSSAIGSFFSNSLGIDLVFSFTGLVIGSIIYSLPFMVQPISNGFSALPHSMLEILSTSTKSKIEKMRYVLLPNIKTSLLSGIVLSFAHTIGEFGLVLMLGGNIPGKTRVGSIAIYDQVESLNYANAHKYSLFLLVISFIFLAVMHFVNSKSKSNIYD